jgi:hypothetical protein
MTALEREYQQQLSGVLQPEAIAEERGAEVDSYIR